MHDFLDILAIDAKETVKQGYYDRPENSKMGKISLKNAIINAKTVPIIAEVKGASPSRGTIRRDFEADKIARSMEKGGAIGISVLTEPHHFKGSIENIIKIRNAVKLPILMKDIIVDPSQLYAASKVGADAVLLIQAIFDRGYCGNGANEMIAKAHSNNLEVLLETHNLGEFAYAIKTKADIIGINNRNLGTLKVDLNVTKDILKESPTKGKLVVSESGITTPADLHFLGESGAQAFLVGSSIMLSSDVEGKVKELVNA